MNTPMLIAGIVAIALGIVVLLLSKATTSLVKAGQIPEEKVLKITLPSGTKVDVLFLMGLLTIVPGVMLITLSFMNVS